METITGAVECTCPEPAKDETRLWCERHQCTKSHVMWVKCRTELAWWTAWEEGRGPRQTKPGQPSSPSGQRPVSLDLAELKMAAERLAGETGDPTVIEKIAHYRKAVTRWTLAGFPTRTDEEVATIHAEHCEPCKKYDAAQKVCTKCGCGVTKTGMAAFNKLRMATESCPLGKWGTDHSPNAPPDEP